MTTELGPRLRENRSSAESSSGEGDGRAVLISQVAADVVAQLQRQGPAAFDVDGVGKLVEMEWARYDGARVRTFVPVLVRRAVLGRMLGH